MPFPSLFRRIVSRRGGGVWCLVLSVLVAHRSFVEYQQHASSVRGGYQDATTTSAKPSSAATSSTATMLSVQTVNHSTALHARSAVAPPPKARHFLNSSDSSVSTVQKHIQHMQNQNVHYAVTIPMVVQMSGEFGNHLSKLASALAVEYELHQRSSQSEPERWQAARNDGTSTGISTGTNTRITFEFRVEWRLQRQAGTEKGGPAVEMLNECFSTLVQAIGTNHFMAESPTTNSSSTSTSSSNSRSSSSSSNALSPPLHVLDAVPPTTRHHSRERRRRRRRAQRDPLSATAAFEGINSDNATIFDAAMDEIVAHAKQSALNTNVTDATGGIRFFTTPFVLHSNYLVHMDTFLARYYHLYQALYALDAHCCGPIAPDDDELVFYLRAFTTEMPRRGVVLGFEELSPQPLVQALAKYYPKSDSSRVKKVAILSRFAHRSQVMDPYVAALQRDGWTVRVVANQTAAQDFCFLQRTTWHLFGPARSTFFQWAALLSGRQDSVRTVTAYSMDTPARRARAAKSQEPLLEAIPFTNPVLQREWEFPLYNNTAS
jgi:hypothetical protein